MTIAKYRKMTINKQNNNIIQKRSPHYWIEISYRHEALLALLDLSLGTTLASRSACRTNFIFSQFSILTPSLSAPSTHSFRFHSSFICSIFANFLLRNLCLILTHCFQESAVNLWSIFDLIRYLFDPNHPFLCLIHSFLCFIHSFYLLFGLLDCLFDLLDWLFARLDSLFDRPDCLFDSFNFRPSSRGLLFDSPGFFSSIPALFRLIFCCLDFQPDWLDLAPFHNESPTFEVQFHRYFDQFTDYRNEEYFTCIHLLFWHFSDYHPCSYTDFEPSGYTEFDSCSTQWLYVQ
jgi:hypothetical protein